MGDEMALLTCADCAGTVSSSAMTCVHCGNVLQLNKPGAIGIILRGLYVLFCVGLAVVGVITVTSMLNSFTQRPSDVLMVPLLLLAIWFGVSIAIAVLLYVTRHGRIERVEGAARQFAQQQG